MLFPALQNALICEGPRKLRLVSDITINAPKPGNVLVKVAAVALNPVDVKMYDFLPCVGAGCGSDYAGMVVAIGKDVDPKKAHWAGADAGLREQDGDGADVLQGDRPMDGPRYVSLDPAPQRVTTTRLNRDVQPYAELAFEALGRDVNLDDPFRRDAQPDKYDFTVRWLRQVEDLLRCNLLVTPPVLLLEGGLAAVPQELNILRTGKVSHLKIVYRV